LLGAEFTRVYANQFGAQVRPAAHAVPAQRAAQSIPEPDARPLSGPRTRPRPQEG
jgi:hypothetical protein